MNLVRTSAVGLAASAVLFSATVAGCGNDKSSTPSSSSSSSSSSATSSSSSTSAASSSPAAQGDYSSLLIKPTDIGPNAFADGAPVLNPSGLTGTGQTFKNPDGSRIIVDTIAINADPAAAAQLLQGMKGELSKRLSAAQQPIDIGSSGFMVIGQSADPAKQMEISEAVFTEGKAVVDLEFDCVPGNPTPADELLGVARKQDAAVKNGLTS
jgi:hypothetical protein